MAQVRTQGYPVSMRRALITVAAVLGTLVLGCSRGTPTPTPTVTPAASASVTRTPTSTPTELPLASGAIPNVVQQALLAGVGNNRDGLVALVHGGALPTSDCKGAWPPPTDVASSIDSGLKRAHDLYAAALLPPAPADWPASVVYGKYVVVFAPAGEVNSTNTFALYLDDAGIVRQSQGCLRPSDLVRGPGNGPAFTFLVAPKSALP
jgi:hypothetical protein